MSGVCGGGGGTLKFLAVTASEMDLLSSDSACRRVVRGWQLCSHATCATLSTGRGAA